MSNEICKGRESKTTEGGRGVRGITPVQLIEAFMNGETQMYCYATGLNENLRISGDKIMYYSDVVCERIGDKFRIHCSGYSPQRGEFERLLLKMIPQDKQI
jgi:hypothetical protein